MSDSIYAMMGKSQYTIKDVLFIAHPNKNAEMASKIPKIKP